MNFGRHTTSETRRRKLNSTENIAIHTEPGCKLDAGVGIEPTSERLMRPSENQHSPCDLKLVEATDEYGGCFMLIVEVTAFFQHSKVALPTGIEPVLLS